MRALNGVLVLSAFLAVGCDRESTAANDRRAAPRASATVPLVADRIYVSNEVGNSVSVIDTTEDRVVATIAVGRRPRAVRVSPDGRSLYVALSGSPRGGPGIDESKLPPPDRSADGIGVVDLESLVLERVLESGPDPESFDLAPNGKQLLVSNEDAARASILDVASGRPSATVGVGEEPEGVAIRPDGKVGYVTSESAHRVDVIALDERRLLTSIATGERPRTVLFSKDGARAFVSNEVGKSVEVIDAEAHRALRRIPIAAPAPALPMGLALSSDERTLWVSTGRGGSVVAVELGSGATFSVDGVGARPWGLALCHDGRRLYTANGPSNDVTVIDTATRAVVRRIAVGASPWGVAAGKDARRE